MWLLFGGAWWHQRHALPVVPGGKADAVDGRRGSGAGAGRLQDGRAARAGAARRCDPAGAGCHVGVAAQPIEEAGLLPVPANGEAADAERKSSVTAEGMEAVDVPAGGGCVVQIGQPKLGA